MKPPLSLRNYSHHSCRELHSRQYYPEMRAARYGFWILEQSQRLQVTTATQKFSIGSSRPWICGDCLTRAPTRPLIQKHNLAEKLRRGFSVSAKRLDSPLKPFDNGSIKEQSHQKQQDPQAEQDNLNPGKDALAAGSPALEEQPVRTTAERLSQEARVNTIKSETTNERIAQETMPSDVQKQRWDMSKRFQVLMDNVMTKATTAGHRVNQYTGTDYSGIEALRQAIVAQGSSMQSIFLYKLF